MGIFKGVSGAKTTSRNNYLKQGTVLALVKTTEYKSATDKRNRKAHAKFTCEVVKGLADKHGLMDTEEGYEGDVKTTIVDLFFQENPEYPDIFAADLKRIGMSGLGISENDFITEDQKAAGVSGFTADDFDEEALPAILGVNAQGEKVGQGILDGHTFIEIRTWFKDHKEQKDPDKITGMLISHPERKVTATELDQYLTDDDKVKYFGSLDAFTAEIAEEAAE